MSFVLSGKAGMHGRNSLSMVSCSGRSKKAQYEAEKRMDRKEFDQLVAHSMRMPGVCFFCTDLIDERQQMIKRKEIEVLESALNDGVVFITGRTILRMSDQHGWFKHFVIDNLYRFLQKNCRSSVATLKIPTEKQLQVEMLYQL